MATRNLTMVVDRKHAENTELGFADNPSVFSDKSYVNMYLHHDGYPEWQGVQIANWVHANGRIDGSAMAAKLVHDMYYDSCYLYADPIHIDHQYTYIIWTGKPDIYVSCYDQYNSEPVFVLKPEKIISKYMAQDDPMDYTDFANGETRSNEISKFRSKHDIQN
tara:strand:+ start:221 stop:709 length:489 start_codon:yes stop_codon:yes gene_type:complete